VFMCVYACVYVCLQDHTSTLLNPPPSPPDPNPEIRHPTPSPSTPNPQPPTRTWCARILCSASSLTMVRSCAAQASHVWVLSAASLVSSLTRACSHPPVSDLSHPPSLPPPHPVSQAPPAVMYRYVSLLAVTCRELIVVAHVACVFSSSEYLPAVSRDVSTCRPSANGRYVSLRVLTEGNGSA